MGTATKALAKRRLVNYEITKHIFLLHTQGYIVDFRLGENQNIICTEDEHHCIGGNFSIRIIDLCYDQFSKSYKYLHVVETECGLRGLLLSDEPLSPPVPSHF